MIINQVNVERVTFFKAKDNAQIAANANAPKTFQVAFQRMQSPAGKQSDFVRTCRLVDCQENVGYFLHEGTR